MTSFRFRVDDGAIKEYMMVSRRLVSADDLGKYVFVLPKVGEFYCEMGVIKNEQSRKYMPDPGDPKGRN